MDAVNFPLGNFSEAYAPSGGVCYRTKKLDCKDFAAYTWPFIWNAPMTQASNFVIFFARRIGFNRIKAYNSAIV